MPKRALVTGITGQDGSYLAELLLSKGYEVHGIVRRSSSVSRTRIDHLRSYELGDDQRLFLHYGDLADSVALVKLLYELEPDEVYNLAAQSHVRVSFDIPEYTADITGVGAARLLEAIVESGIGKKVRYYQASSSEMFGKVQAVPQTETTPLYPRSPYACAKVFAHYLTINYRESYGLFACSGILFNHESPRRGENFVTRKITIAAARIKAGLQKELYLGNLDSKRDWGYAPEYVEGMWRMLQAERPDDYVLATNETHTIGEFLDTAFGRVGLDWHDHVRFDPKFLRPAEVDLLIGDYAKAKKALDWEPRTRMKDLAELMVDADYEGTRKRDSADMKATSFTPLADGPAPLEITLRPTSGWLDIELAGLWHYRDLLSLLVWRDFAAKYKQTILGPLWFIVQPLIMTVTFTIMFGKVANLPTDGLPPMLFYLCGQLGWNYFAQSLSTNAATLAGNAAIFSKVYFPRLVIPVAGLISNLFAFVIQAGLFVFFYAYYKYALGVGGFGCNWHIVFLPLIILQAALFSLGVGLVISAVTAKYRDLTHVTGLIVQIWMYATPVIFPLSKFPPKWQVIVSLNPMTEMVESLRYMLLGSGTVKPEFLICSIALTLVSLAAGLLLFGKVEKTFVDYV